MSSANAEAPDLLGTIVAATRRVVAVREARRSVSELARDQQREPQGWKFEQALSGSAGEGSRLPQAARIIAECKRRSPSKGILRENYAPAAHARAYADAGAVAISVLTEPTFFDGHPDHLHDVRLAVDIPLLRKDFVLSEYQLVEAAVLGADAVLLIVGALEQAEMKALIRAADALHLAALVEVHDLRETERAVEAGARVIGVNSRNLRTLSVDLAVLDEVADQLPDGVIAVAESGIRAPADLLRLAAAGYDAFLVGERLITESDPGAALRELCGR
jgi:indole-3-glycerol phosphate synthase